VRRRQPTGVQVESWQVRALTQSLLQIQPENKAKYKVEKFLVAQDSKEGEIHLNNEVSSECVAKVKVGGENKRESFVVFTILSCSRLLVPLLWSTNLQPSHPSLNCQSELSIGVECY
jgi:hypothetical protein